MRAIFDSRSPLHHPVAHPVLSCLWHPKFPPTAIPATHGPCSGQGSSFGAPKLPASVLTGLSGPGHPRALPTFAGRAVGPSAPFVNTPLVAPCCQQIKSPNSVTQPGRLFPASPAPSCPPSPCLHPASLLRDSWMSRALSLSSSDPVQGLLLCGDVTHRAGWPGWRSAGVCSPWPGPVGI